MPELLRTLHDRVSKVSFLIAAIALAVMMLSYCFEVFSRYLLKAPTVWVSPMTSYILCAMIFLSVPELTRQSSHIYIDYLESHLSKESATLVARSIRWIAFVTCMGAAWFTTTDTLDALQSGMLTNTYMPVPKWWLAILIPYAFLSAGLHFLRQALGEDPPVAEGPAA